MGLTGRYTDDAGVVQAQLEYYNGSTIRSPQHLAELLGVTLQVPAVVGSGALVVHDATAASPAASSEVVVPLALTASAIGPPSAAAASSDAGPSGAAGPSGTGLSVGDDTFSTMSLVSAGSTRQTPDDFDPRQLDLKVTWLSPY